MRKYKHAIFWLLLAVLSLVGCAQKQAPRLPTFFPPAPTRPQPKSPLVPTPHWVTVPPQRAANESLGAVLADIDSHMPLAHIYRARDKVTWGHETTHGLNSRIRNGYGDTGGVNAFYALKNRAAVLAEPRTTIATVARYVPPSLRGAITWDPYLVGKAARDWNSRPLYLVDELSAYTNGANTGLDLAYRGLWTQGQRWDTVQNMLEFQVYTMTLMWVVVNRCPDYDPAPLKTFLMWEIYRGRALLAYSKRFPDFSNPGLDAYCQALATNADADRLRGFARAYFGAEWCRQILGF